MHALKFPLQSRECLDKDNINLRAVSLELNRLSLSLSQTIAIAKIERLIGVQVVQTLQGLLGIHTTARV